MAAVEHSSSFAKQAGVPQSVGKEFIQADKRAGKYKHKLVRKSHDDSFGYGR